MLDAGKQSKAYFKRISEIVTKFSECRMYAEYSYEIT